MQSALCLGRGLVNKDSEKAYVKYFVETMQWGVDGWWCLLKGRYFVETMQWGVEVVVFIEREISRDEHRKERLCLPFFISKILKKANQSFLNYNKK